MNNTQSPQTLMNPNENNNTSELSLPDLVQNLEQQKLTKKDIVVNPLFVTMEGGHIVIKDYKDTTINAMLADAGIQTKTQTLTLTPNTHAHAQLADKLDIAKRYYDRILGQDDNILIDANVSYWMQRYPKNLLFRSFINEGETEGILRGVLSERFGILDNFDVLMATLDAVRNTGMNIKIESSSITDTNMYVRFICPEIYTESKALLENYRVPRTGRGTGEMDDFKIYSGFILSNSEVGKGQFKISARAIVSKCDNGMIFHDENFKKTHLGAKMDEGSINWSQQTTTKNYELIMSQVKDAVNVFASKDFLGRKVDELEGKNLKTIEHPNDAVKNIGQSMNLSDTKIQEILNYFIKGDDNSPFGISNALNLYAYQQNNADLRYELEEKSVSVLSEIEMYDRPFKPTKRGLSEVR